MTTIEHSICRKAGFCEVTNNIFLNISSRPNIFLAKTEDEDVIEALVTFMEKLAPGSMRNTLNWGWNTSSDPCTSKWQGVTCDTDNKTVKKIILEQLNLTGTLDFESVCKESSLLLLSLNYNSLIGSLPQEISNCKRLRHLYLSGNRFSGNLPDSLTELTNLKRIDISNNGFTGKLPDISRITGLLSFFAQNNRFTGQLPNFNYLQLEDFDVSNNDFSGQIPDDTGRFGANSFAGNPQLCGKELPNACPVKKKKQSNSNDFLIYSGYVILSLIVLVLIALLLLKKKQQPEDTKIGSSVEKGVKNTDDGGRSSESKSGGTRSEFSITSAESGGVSASLVVLSSPVEAVNGLRFKDLLRAPAELIGRGKHGSLYKVMPNGGIAFVVKRIKDWDISRDEFKKRMQRIDQVKHPKVLPLVAYYCSKQEKLLVYEFQQNGSLFRLLHGSQNGQAFDWGSRLNVASSTAEALAFMHAELQDDRIAHGNLKSSNILLKNDMEPCLSEYGLMVIDNNGSSSDDETSSSSQNSNPFKVDVHAFGVILLELLTGKPVQGNGFDLAKWVNSVVKEEWTCEVFDKALVVEGASEERMVGLLQIALKCINGSPDLRPSIGEVATMIVSLKEEEERSMASSDP